MIKLHEHSQKAYDATLAMIAEHGKAAVIHPTGTGKSFIGFRMTEEFSGSRFLWETRAKISDQAFLARRHPGCGMRRASAPGSARVSLAFDSLATTGALTREEQKHARGGTKIELTYPLASSHLLRRNHLYNLWSRIETGCEVHLLNLYPYPKPDKKMCIA